jgi:DNA-binding CsgD family transcriptional regulator
MTSIWDDYANWATILGRLDVARPCREKALFIARERRIAWRIPYLTLRFAAMLVISGEYEQARDLISDVLTYDTTTPALSVLLSSVAVELAIILGDEALLKRTMTDDNLDLALQSEEPERIAPLVAAYVKVSLRRGQRSRAKILLSKGMKFLNQADYGGEVFVLAAGYGTQAEAERARAILLQRMKLPHHRVARAYLALWEAYDARRHRNESTLREQAQNAAQLFGRLGWKHQQFQALSLIGAEQSMKQNQKKAGKSMLSSLHPELTTREQEIADLVLRGLTNRAVAQLLGISEHTVETHMTSILNRLGLRSRWQLIDLSRS